MSNQSLKVDNIDRRIIQLIQKKPNITHTEIANEVGRSQPTVGIRIKKLEDNGFIEYQAGINIKNSELNFARMEIETKEPDKFLEQVKSCPFMLNALKLSGSKNLLILMASPNLELMDEIGNEFFRNSDEVISFSIDFILDFVTDLVLPIEFKFEKCDCPLKQKCIKSLVDFGFLE